MPHLLPVAPSVPPPIVLIVEDDLDTVELYEEYLNGSGYWVATAQNSHEGCRTFDELQPDIVVADLGLPYFEPCPNGCGRFFRDHNSGRYYRLP
jgi:CheY-like chemotaxis protein